MEESRDSQVNRLKNDEFRQFIHHLELKDYFLTQIKFKGVWNMLFNINYKPQKQFSSIRCNLCSEKVEFKDFFGHLKNSNHVKSLKNVEQFYHPLYTYGKHAEKLAKGEPVSAEEMQKAISERDESLTGTIEDSKLELAERVAEYLCSMETSSDTEGTLTSMVLNTNATKPEFIYAKAALPLEDLLKVEFSVTDGEWKPMLTTKNAHLKGKYFCGICSKNCVGIITVNAHLRGYLHKGLQLETLGVRVPSYDQLTKNCTYRYERKYSFEIKEGGRKIFMPKVMKMLGIQTDSSDVDNKNGLKTDADELPSAIRAKVKALKGNANICKDPEGLIGVEYVVKMKSHNESEVRYECCLCEIVLNETLMQGHLISYNHRLKYCEIHFADTIKKYKVVIGHVKYLNYLNIMGYILAKMASAIEKHHGRSLPYVVSASQFAEMRSEIVAKVYSFRNACQQHGPSFSNLLTPEEKLKYIKNNEKYIPSSASKHVRFTVTPKGKVYLDQRSHDPNVRSGNFVGKNDRRAKSKSPKSRTRSVSPYPSYESRHVSSRGSGGRSHLDIWKVYREEISNAAIEVERTYNQYRRNPESHPSYDLEWNKFWKRRKDELVSQGIDHRSYNYQPEWVQFFRQRLEQLFGADLHKSKIDVRKRLNIPLDAEEDSNYRDSVKESFEKQRADDIEPPTKRACYNDGSLNMNTHVETQWKPPSYNSDISPNEQVTQILDDKPNVIHVLRLMTALEDHLGSLGSKIMDLLSKALMVEKACVNNPAQLEEKILTVANCTLLETAVEKLKGILFAGLLDRTKIQGFNRVINYTTELLNHAEKMGWRTGSPEYPEKSNSETELQKLLEAMQKNRSDGSSSNQKSLSETLMDLISLQRGNTNSGNSNFPKDTNLENEKIADFPRNFKPNYRGPIAHNMPKLDNQGLLSDQSNITSMKCMSNLTKFDTSLSAHPVSNANTNMNRNMKSFGGGYTQKNFGNATDNNGGSGRNNFNNYNYNAGNDNPAGIAKMKQNISNNGMAFQGLNSLGSRPQTNYREAANNSSLNMYRNNVGNNSGENWGRFQMNNQQWVPNQQQQHRQNQQY